METGIACGVAGLWLQTGTPCSFSSVSKLGWVLPGLEWEVLLGERILSWDRDRWSQKHCQEVRSQRKPVAIKNLKHFALDNYVGCWQTKRAVLMSVVHGIGFWRPALLLLQNLLHDFYLITWCETITASLEDCSQMQTGWHAPCWLWGDMSVLANGLVPGANLA